MTPHLEPWNLIEKCMRCKKEVRLGVEATRYGVCPSCGGTVRLVPRLELVKR